jgi:hypothetical protein
MFAEVEKLSAAVGGVDGSGSPMSTTSFHFGEGMSWKMKRGSIRKFHGKALLHEKIISYLRELF